MLGLLKATSTGSEGREVSEQVSFTKTTNELHGSRSGVKSEALKTTTETEGYLAVITSPATLVLQKRDLGSLILSPLIADWMSWRTKLEYFI